MSLSKVKDTDYEIMYKLSDKDLGRLCSTNSHFRKLCKIDTFWRNRTVMKYGQYLGGVEGLDRYRLLYRYPNWRRYYIEIVDYFQHLNVYHLMDTKDREDLRILTEIYDKNTEVLFAEFKSNYSSDKWEDMLKETVLVNPNELLARLTLNRENIDVFNYLLDFQDERINPNVLLTRLLKAEPTWDIKILTNKILQDWRIELDKVIVSIVEFVNILSFGEKDYSVLDQFLDYVRKQKSVPLLQKRLSDEVTSNINWIKHIYKYLKDETESSLPEILKILEEGKFTHLQYDAILKNIKQVKKGRI